MLGLAAGIGALWLIRESLAPGTCHRRDGDGRRQATDRRQFLRHSGAVLGGLAAGAALVGGLGRRLGGRFTAAQSRAAVMLPPAAERLPALPAVMSRSTSPG